ncbi:MAG: hypothetical protein AAGF87_10285 [Bacteroidota bacterium]
MIHFAKTILTCLFILCCHNSKAQDIPRSDGSEYPAIILADPRSESIRLRWAPTTFEHWKMGNENGYSIYRSEQNIPGSRKLLGDDFIPLPLSAWRPITDTLQAALMYAGALYSEDLINPEVPDELQDRMAYLQSVEEYRFGLSLFSADQFYEVALAAGLAFIDEGIENGKIYIYEVQINGVILEDGDIYPNVKVSSDARTVLPPPPELKGEWAEKTVELSWDQSASSFFYSSYDIERSVGSGPWEQVNELPIVFFDAEDLTNQDVYYVDTLANNEEEHRYRLRGRSYFGVDGLFGDEIIGRGKPGPIPHTPVITNLIQIGENALRIEWSFPFEASDLIKGFKIYRSTLSSQLGELISPWITDVSQRSFVDPGPKSNRFYTVIAVDQNNYEIHSLARLISLEDDMPPSPPVGLSGSMDSTGVVHLSWNPNSEPDHQGYRIYIANQEEGYFIQITPDAIAETNYEHQATMETLSEAVYFKIKAIDYYGNYSDFSEVVRVKRPDNNPPVAPRILEIEGRGAGVFLSWAPSPSRDIVNVTLQRRPQDENTQGWLDVWEDGTSAGSFITSGDSFLDENTQIGRTYLYRIMAIDDSGLQNVSPSSTATRIDSGRRGEVRNFRAVRQLDGSVQLYFSFDYPAEASLFQVFRSIEEEPMRTYLQLDPGDDRLIRNSSDYFQIKDSQISNGKQVRYQLLVRFPDGGFSNLAETILLED